MSVKVVTIVLDVMMAVVVAMVVVLVDEMMLVSGGNSPDRDGCVTGHGRKHDMRSWAGSTRGQGRNCDMWWGLMLVWSWWVWMWLWLLWLLVVVIRS